MAKETPDFQVSPPARKKGPTEPIEKSENKSGKMFDALKKLKKQTEESKKRADKISEQTNALKSYGDVPEVEKSVDAEKMALKKKEKREKAKTAETWKTRKETLKKQLTAKGATEEALFAFEQAYNPKVAPAIREILTGQKLDIREPETWNTVHNRLTEYAKDNRQYNEEYVSAYFDKHQLPILPLVPVGKKVVPESKLEPMVAEGEFEPMDLSMTDEEAQSPEALAAMRRVEAMMAGEKGPRGLEPDEEIALTGALAIVHPEILNMGWTDETDYMFKTYAKKHRAEGRNMQDVAAWTRTMNEVDETIAKEPPVYVADFENVDLEGENIIKGDKEGQVAEKPPSDKDMTRVSGISTRKPR